MAKTATGVILMDFMFRQCRPLSITEIADALTAEGAAIDRRTIAAHVSSLCHDYPDRCSVQQCKHQYRRLPVKKYFFYPEIKKCPQT